MRQKRVRNRMFVYKATEPELAQYAIDYLNSHISLTFAISPCDDSKCKFYTIINYRNKISDRVLLKVLSLLLKLEMRIVVHEYRRL